MKTNPNDIASGIPATEYNNLMEGLTKREHFAAQAMQGMLANDATAPITQLTAWSVEAADELIKALNN